VKENVANQCRGLTGNESSQAILLLGAKVPGSKRAKERKGQGVKVPGSELAQERKGCESSYHCPVSSALCIGLCYVL